MARRHLPSRFQPEPYWWEAYAPAARRARRGAARGAGGDRRRRLCRAVGGARIGEARGRRGRARSGARSGSAPAPATAARSAAGSISARAFPAAPPRSTPERARRLLSDAADAFSLIERLIAEEGIECFWQKHGRFVGAWTPKHYAYQEKRLARPQRRCAIRRLHGAARAPARGDRQRLLLWRHGRRALGQPASGALLQGAARCLPAPRHRGLRRGLGRADRARTAPAGGSRPAAARSPPAMS